MDSKYIIPVLMGIVLLGGLVMASVPATAIADIENTVATKANVNAMTAKAAKPMINKNFDIKNPNAVEINEALRAKTPKTYEETKTIVKSVETPHKFIFWTHDGNHVILGEYGNGFFIADDVDGTHVWGSYNAGRFLGFYGGDEFSGNYRQGPGHLWNWRALNLFGETVTYGKFILFP